ncbi:glycosyl hydrolase family 28-related protein [Asaia prunellae]|uniref:glycosyl hydrolase family 28-related protein n=1 Tax=Asaia prunellae TaxID=610245 RepID=UPI00046EE626|nr:glycosyl hydrolase family 28-related protein [Asaia prunellae]
MYRGLCGGTLLWLLASSSAYALPAPTFDKLTIKQGLTSGGLLQPPFVSILAKGAKCDGTTDDTVAINAVLSAYNNVAIPQGISKCLVSSPINITRNGTTLVGAGQTSVTFVSNSATAPVISVAAGLSNYTLSGFSVDRSVAPTSDTARGIDTSGGGGGFATCGTSMPPINGPDFIWAGWLMALHQT